MKLLAPLFAMTLLSAAPPTVQEPVLRAHLAFLADDLLEGRGTGQRGGDLAVAYLEAQVRALGLKPVAGGSYRQRVDVLGERTDLGRSAVTFRGQGGTLAPVLLEDLVAIIIDNTPFALIVPVVFGQFLQAPEDFKAMRIPLPQCGEDKRFQMSAECITLDGCHVLVYSLSV